VLVLESDDWGLRRRPCADLVAAWGEPTGWAEEHGETAADLDRLAEVLLAHRDPEGRAAVLTMNVITANPDFDAIEADGFRGYHDQPVDRTLDPDALAALRRGVDGRVFNLQLHGRSHLQVERWLDDLRRDHPGARPLFDARVDGGLSLVRAESWRYHSELLDWTTGDARSADDLEAWLAPAVATVERLSGEPPRASVAPHYVLTATAEEAWERLGIEFVQATDYQLAPGDDRPRPSYLGQRRDRRLVHLTRTARFDPRPQRQGHHRSEAVATVTRCFAQGLPAVVDTHRINFTGPWAAQAADELDALLTAADASGARYLATPELGEAVAGDGTFTDWARGSRRRLTPIGGVARRLTRAVAR
jgi:hypothetical protein